MASVFLADVMIRATVLPALAGDVLVKGYISRDGTYVQPHMRSALDGNASNNLSTYPNVNPYTGQQGAQQPNLLDGSTSGFGSGTNTWGSFGTSPQQPRSRSDW